MPYYLEDTIAAIATPPGEGGVAIIRISGKKALEIGNKVFSKNVLSFESHKAHFGSVIDQKGHMIDEALLIVMKGTHSYTGEDTVEIQCHGGILISREVLNVVREAGSRLAEPGEFTFRAFKNGKIDLVQAESIQELIHAKNEKALAASEEHLKGSLSKRLQGIKESLLTSIALLEAWVDFPEEGLDFKATTQLDNMLGASLAKIKTLMDTFHDGQKIKTGISLCLLGAPNVGKSSLMNALLKKERAIVTEIAGTTRDILEEELMLGGVHFQLLDTAGLRKGGELIEEEGIRRAKKKAKEADLILFVLDATKGVTKEEKEILEEIDHEKTIGIWNKTDLPHGTLTPLPLQTVSLSAKEEQGLESLKEALHRSLFTKPLDKGEVLITNERHYEMLKKASDFIEGVKTALTNSPQIELLVLDLRSAVQSINELLGGDVSEEVLGAIFSQFCVGK